MARYPKSKLHKSESTVSAPPATVAVETVSLSDLANAVPSRPSLAEIESAEIVEVSHRLKSPNLALIAGLALTHAPKQYAVAFVRAQGASHMRALATDPTIIVRIIK